MVKYICLILLTLLLTGCNEYESVEPVTNVIENKTEEEFKNLFVDTIQQNSGIVVLNENTISYSFPKEFIVDVSNDCLKVDTSVAIIDIKVRNNIVMDYELDDFKQKCNEKAIELIGEDIQLVEEISDFMSASELFTRGSIFKPIVFMGNNLYSMPYALVRFKTDNHSILLEATLKNPKKTFSKVNVVSDCNISHQEFNVMLLELSNVINSLFYGSAVEEQESVVLEGKFPYYYEEQVEDKFLKQLDKEEMIYHTYITTGVDKLNIFAEEKYFECFKTADNALSWYPADGLNNSVNFDIVYKNKDYGLTSFSEDILSWSKTYVSPEFLDSKYFSVISEEFDTYSYSEELGKATAYYVRFLPETEDCILPVMYVFYDLGDRYILARGLLVNNATKYLLSENSVEDSIILADDFNDSTTIYNEVFYRINEKLKGLLRLIYLEDLESEALNEK